jgi:hypothetical protein
MSLFDVRYFQLCQRGITTGKLKIYTIDGSKDCAKNMCNSMIIMTRRLNTLHAVQVDLERLL